MKIIWVFGNGAVGKESFIRKINKNNNLDISQSLGFLKEDSIILEESLNWISYDLKSDLLKKRKELHKIINKKSSQNKNLLVKGQFVDLEENILNKLNKLNPNCEQVILYLKTSPEENFNRLKKKPWFKPSFNIERVKKLQKYESELMKKIDFQIKIIEIESGDNFNYKIIR